MADILFLLCMQESTFHAKCITFSMDAVFYLGIPYFLILFCNNFFLAFASRRGERRKGKLQIIFHSIMLTESRRQKQKAKLRRGGGEGRAIKARGRGPSTPGQQKRGL